MEGVAATLYLADQLLEHSRSALVGGLQIGHKYRSCSHYGPTTTTPYCNVLVSSSLAE